MNDDLVALISELKQKETIEMTERLFNFRISGTSH